jgi:hypothetical protein
MLAKTTKRIKNKQKPSPPPQKFVPQKSSFSPSHVCWDAVLSNQAAMQHLGSWRWLRTLALVFRPLPCPPECLARWLCGDATIWKSKANDLFALTAKDLSAVPYKLVETRYKQVHLIPRSVVLHLALAKHRGTVAAINAAFLARKERNSKRKRRA